MNRYERRSPQKTIPRSIIDTRLVRNEPNMPTTPFQALPDLSIEIPVKLPKTNGAFRVTTVHREITGRKHRGKPKEITVLQITPIVKGALTPLFEFKNRDGETIRGGGGTSKEALRRAKQKARAQKSPQK